MRAVVTQENGLAIASLWRLAALNRLKARRNPALFALVPSKGVDALPLRLPLAFIWMGYPASCICCCACCCTGGCACCYTGGCTCCCTCCPIIFPWICAPPAWAIAGCIMIGSGGTGFWMITTDVEVIGLMSTGISSPWAAACSIQGVQGGWGITVLAVLGGLQRDEHL
jgi:hypothetical protein